MQWYKHHTSANRDEKLARIQDEFGLEGYGLYWLLLELIGEQMNSDDKTFLTYSAQNWRRITGVLPKKFEKFLNFSQKLKLFLVEMDDGLITVNCPNLLKVKDNYSKKRTLKKAKCTDTGRTPNKEKELELELELDLKKENKKSVTLSQPESIPELDLDSPPTAPVPTARPPQKRPTDPRFDEFYQAYPVKKSKAAAFKAFEKLDPDETLFAEMLAAIEEQVNNRELAIRHGVFVAEWKHPATWINGECWDDEPGAIEPKQRNASPQQTPRQVVSAAVMDVQDTDW